ncbi:MAG: transketolase C-terminal domain-containing protein, partial [Sphingomonadaceae bacterium]
GTSATHGSPLGKDEVAAARAELGWNHPPFEIPSEIGSSWLDAGRRGAAVRTEWQGRLSTHSEKKEFERRMAGELPAGFSLKPYLDSLLTSPQKVATRKASELALGAINAQLPETLGGSADLTGSNNTKTKDQSPLTADNYGGRYVYYGIREFGMGAAMNGMALHGGVIPYGGTFLVFSDYCRPAIRLAALQQIRSIFVMTHDSIGLGEDGPTHQPIEHVVSLRLMPNLDVYRPADIIETAECWQLALERADGPSLLALTRQNLPQIRTNADENLCAKGAYRLRSATAARKVVLIASGSEVEIALGVADKLEAAGVGADVVSMPSWSRFDAQPAAYRGDVLPHDVLRVSIEAGTTIGWERYVGIAGLRFGIDGFGASAPGDTLYHHFGLTAEAITPQVLAALQ